MSTELNNSHKKLTEALELLNEAAREKKEEIQTLIGDRYSDIQDAMHAVAVQGRRNFKKAKRMAEGAIEEGQERFEDTIEDVNKEVHKNPWAYIGGAALGALLLGFVLGNSGRRN